MCHTFEGRGGRIGPDLSDARRLGADRLLASIVQPSAEIAPQFVTWAIELDDRPLMTGMLVTERGDDQTFVDQQGQLFIINRDQVALKRPLETSIMPANVIESMTLGEVADVLAFLNAAPVN